MNSPERQSQVALAGFLRSGARAQANFLSAVSEKLFADYGAYVPYEVRCEYETDRGKRIDILLTSSSSAHAIILELKIDHRHNPGQHTGYKDSLKQLGMIPVSIGIAPRLRGGGSGAAITARVADCQTTWARLVEKLGSDDEHCAQFGERICEIVGALVSERIPDLGPLSSKNIARIEEEGIWMAFLDDFRSRLPDSVSNVLHQAGTSPPLLRFGRREWGNWFGDFDHKRLFLMVDLPRRSGQFPETVFHFGVTIWNKDFAGTKQPNNSESLSEFAQLLAQRKFWFQRNVVSKSRQTIWESPYSLERTGFKWATGFDERNFCLHKSKASELGWGGTLDLLKVRSIELMALMDHLTASGGR